MSMRMKNGKKKVKTSVSLGEDLTAKLKSVAKKERRSVSQLIELWLEDSLAVHQSLKPAR